MSTSTDGQICYGFALEDGAELPWHKEEYDNDIGEWWLYAVCKYPRKADGVVSLSKEWHEYIDGKFAFRKQNPCPVELVNTCSANCPMWIIAIPSSIRFARRGYPIAFAPSDLQISPDDTARLLGFCETHGIATVGKSAWYLSSYWG